MSEEVGAIPDKNPSRHPLGGEEKFTDDGDFMSESMT
jgi:hypothetical protein